MINPELKKKLDNYWYYYKLHTFVAIFILIAIIVTVSTRDTSIKYGLNFTAINNYIQSDRLDNFQKKISANVTLMQIGGKTDPTIQMANTTKLIAGIQVGDIDVIIIDKETYKNYANQGLFMKLDDLIKSGKLPEPQSVEKVTEKGSEYIAGIDVKNSKILTDEGLNLSDMVMGIAATSKHVDSAVKCINLLLKK
jgi:ABC-type glycerol-3-phosphate transport system substrate-binding protein